MEENIFQTFKEVCDRACHARHACAKGYKQMLASENVSQMMATWRDNWDDVVGSKFSETIRTELPRLYPVLKDDMNKAGIYLNECPDDAKNFVRVIITDCDEPVKVYGDAQAYIIGVAKVIAFNHSKVYNNHYKADVMLYGYSFGEIMAGTVRAYDRSKLQCDCEAYLLGNVQCDAFGGIVKASSYVYVNAYRDTIVYAGTDKGIILSGTSQLKSIEKDE